MGSDTRQIQPNPRAIRNRRPRLIVAMFCFWSTTTQMQSRYHCCFFLQSISEGARMALAKEV